MLAFAVELELPPTERAFVAWRNTGEIAKHAPPSIGVNSHDQGFAAA
jgi:hypothetical protein